MRHTALRPALLAGLLIVSPVAVNADPSDVRPDVAAFAERVELSLLAERIGDLFAGILTQVEAVPGTEDVPGLRAAWDQARARAFDPASVESDLVSGISLVSVADLAEFSAFFETDLGARIREAELAAMRGPVGDAEELMAEFALAKSKWDGLDPEHPRRKAVHRLMDAAHTLDTETAAMSNISYAMVSGMFASLGMEMDDAELRSVCGCDKATVRAALAESLPPAFSYIYADFSSDEIDTYARFGESNAAQAYFGAFSAAYIELMDRRARIFGTELGRILSARDG